MADARDIIAALELAPHPEGGWYRETWRAAAGPGERSPGTAILFLLEAGEASRWHRVDATETWLFHAGTPLTLLTSDDTVRLGPNPLGGDRPQYVVAPGMWQAAEAGDGWALVGCVVVPGFDFTGFELALPGWEP